MPWPKNSPPEIPIRSSRTLAKRVLAKVGTMAEMMELRTVAVMMLPANSASMPIVALTNEPPGMPMDARDMMASAARKVLQSPDVPALAMTMPWAELVMFSKENALARFLMGETPPRMMRELLASSGVPVINSV